MATGQEMRVQESNKQVAMGWLKSIATGDAAALKASMTDDVVHHMMGATVLAGIRDRDALCEVAVQLRQAMKRNIKLKFLAVTAEEDRVAVELESFGEPVTGGAYNNVYHMLFYLRDGKICRVKEYADSKIVDDLFARMSGKAHT